MHNNPLVTVICLCYNHAKFVVEALESVLNQTYSNVELIIADDFSSDDSVKVIQNWLIKHPHIFFLENKTNLGNTKTFNQCLKIAQGEYIIDLAADDILKPECIALQLKGFKETTYKNAAIIYGNAELISEKGDYIKDYFETNSDRKRIKNQPTGNIYMGLLNGNNNVCSISSMIKKSVLDTLGGFDENLAYEDYDFWLRTARNFELDYIDEILVQKRVLPNSMYTLLYQKSNARTRKFNYSTYLILQKVYSLNSNKAEYVAMLKRIHFEMTVAFKTKDYKLLWKYIVLELKVRMRILKT